MVLGYRRNVCHRLNSTVAIHARKYKYNHTNTTGARSNYVLVYSVYLNYRVHVIAAAIQPPTLISTVRVLAYPCVLDLLCTTGARISMRPRFIVLVCSSFRNLRLSYLNVCLSLTQFFGSCWNVDAVFRFMLERTG